jgi:hypothetical protein
VIGQLGFNISVQQCQNQNNHHKFEQGANYVLLTSTIPTQHFCYHFQNRIYYSNVSLVVGRCDGSAIAAVGNQKTYVKPEAAITVFELLMMGGESP